MNEAVQIIQDVIKSITLLILTAFSLFPLLEQFTTPAQVRRRSVVIGVIFGLGAFISSSLPIQLWGNNIIDGRAGLMMFAGYLGGPVGALVAGILGGTARAIQGGPFAMAGLVSYFLYAFAGCAVAWFFKRRNEQMEVSALPTAIMIALCWMTLANALLFIRPLELALDWLRTGAPFVCVSITVSGTVVAFTLRFTLQASTNRHLVTELAERLELATTGAGIGVFDYDPVSDQTRWNDEQYRLHGLNKDETPLTWDVWMSCVQPHDQERVRDTLRDTLNSGSSYDIEYMVPTDGRDEKVL